MKDKNTYMWKGFSRYRWISYKFWSSYLPKKMNH